MLVGADSGFRASTKYRDRAILDVEEEASELLTDPVEFARIRMLMGILLVFDAAFVLFDEATDAVILKEMYDGGDVYMNQFSVAITGIALMLASRIYLIWSNPYVAPEKRWLFGILRFWFLIEPKSGLYMIESYTYAPKTGGGDARRAAQAQQRISEQRIEALSDIAMICFEDVLELGVQIWYQYAKDGHLGGDGLVTLSITATILHVFRQAVEIWFDINTIDPRKFLSPKVVQIHNQEKLLEAKKQYTGNDAKSSNSQNAAANVIRLLSFDIFVLATDITLFLNPKASCAEKIESLSIKSVEETKTRRFVSAAYGWYLVRRTWHYVTRCWLAGHICDLSPDCDQWQSCANDDDDEEQAVRVLSSPFEAYKQIESSKSWQDSDWETLIAAVDVLLSHEDGKFAAFRELEFDPSVRISPKSADNLATLVKKHDKLVVRGSTLVDTLSALKLNGALPIMQSDKDGKETEPTELNLARLKIVEIETTQEELNEEEDGSGPKKSLSSEDTASPSKTKSEKKTWPRIIGSAMQANTRLRDVVLPNKGVDQLAAWEFASHIRSWELSNQRKLRLQSKDDLILLSLAFLYAERKTTGSGALNAVEFPYSEEVMLDGEISGKIFEKLVDHSQDLTRLSIRKSMDMNLVLKLVEAALSIQDELKGIKSSQSRQMSIASVSQATSKQPTSIDFSQRHAPAHQQSKGRTGSLATKQPEWCNEFFAHKHNSPTAEALEPFIVSYTE